MMLSGLTTLWQSTYASVVYQILRETTLEHVVTSQVKTFLHRLGLPDVRMRISRCCGLADLFCLEPLHLTICCVPHSSYLVLQTNFTAFMPYKPAFVPTAPNSRHYPDATEMSVRALLATNLRLVNVFIRRPRSINRNFLATSRINVNWLFDP